MSEISGMQQVVEDFLENIESTRNSKKIHFLGTCKIFEEINRRQAILEEKIKQNRKEIDESRKEIERLLLDNKTDYYML